jgi:biofilm PGA synthesis N-glycosyltransferase PgaC
LFSTITIGICAYNEESNIGRLLHNILSKQQLIPESEVLVVCSGCTDNTVKIVNEFEKKDERIKLIIEKERKGKASAINHILSKAKGDVIIFISADTIPTKNCFPKLISKMEDKNIGVVCGKPVPINKPTSLIGKIVQILWTFHDRVFVEAGKKDEIRHASEIFCIRRSIVNQIPVEIVNDDSYIALTAKKKDWKISYLPGAIVMMSGPKTIADYVKQRRRIIWGHHQVKKFTGKSPQYLVYFIPFHPIKALKFALMLITDKRFLSVSAYLLLEFLINFLVIFDVLSGKSYVNWSVSETTKLIPNLLKPNSLQ